MTGFWAAERARAAEAPLLAALSSALRRELLEHGEPVQLPEGGQLMAEGEAPDRLYVLLDGELSLSAGGQLITLIDAAPQVIGLLGLLDGLPRSATLRAFSPATLLAIDRATFEAGLARHPADALAVARHLVGEIREQHAARAAQREAYDGFFDHPNASLVEGPYHLEAHDERVFLIEVDEARVSRLLPPGVHLEPGAAAIAVSEVGAARSERRPERGALSYLELAVYLPCRFEGRAAWFVPEIYADSFLSIAIGRELYALPKRHGRIRLGDRRVDLDHGGGLAARLAWRSVADGQALDHPLASGEAVEIITRRQVPEPGTGGADQVDELTAVRLDRRSVEAPRALTEPRLDVHAPWLLEGRCVAAWVQRLEVRLSAPRLLRDLSARARPAGGSSGGPARVRKRWRLLGR